MAGSQTGWAYTGYFWNSLQYFRCLLTHLMMDCWKQKQILAMLYSNLCVLCSAAVQLHHRTVVLHTLLVCVNHFHRSVSVDHVYSVQNVHTVTAVLLSLIGYWTLCLSTRWEDLTEGVLQCRDSHCTCLAFLFSNGPAGEKHLRTHVDIHLFPVFMYLEHAPRLVPCILGSRCI
jgi:hypothetical protein